MAHENRTTMYSIDPRDGKVVEHHLPWTKIGKDGKPDEYGEKALARYVAKGFTFERPVIEEPVITIEEAPAEDRVVYNIESEEPRIQDGFYTCKHCTEKNGLITNHRETSTIGKRHLKYR